MKLKEMERHLNDCGIEYYQILITSTKGFNPTPHNKFQIEFDWGSQISRKHEFKNFDDFYDFVMNYTGPRWTCTGAYV